MRHPQTPRVPAYTDVSHFRAPYKNVWSLGATDNGAPPPPGPVEPLTPGGNGNGAIAALFDVKDGTYYFKPAVRDQIMAMLLTHKVVFIGGPTERVQVSPYTPEEIQAMKTPEGQAMLAPFQASKWVADRYAEGKVVFAPAWILAPIEGGTKELAAIPAGETDRVKEAASTPQVGILAGEPKSGLLAALTGANMLVAVAALGVVGGGYYLYKNRNKRRRAPVPTFG